MVCDDKVGWRNESRRVIIFTTDQSFHIAMDGKLGGLVTPNDGKCHLNETGYYTYSTVQDYPSIGHINYIAKENSVNIIWAVTEDKYTLYQGLSQVVSGSSAGVLSADSSNIVDLVRQQYEAITTRYGMRSVGH
jgi:integrin beta 1